MIADGILWNCAVLDRGGNFGVPRKAGAEKVVCWRGFRGESGGPSKLRVNKQPHYEGWR